MRDISPTASANVLAGRGPVDPALPPSIDPWPAPRASIPVDIAVSLPGSKSLTNRALVLAALADGPSVVRRALRSRDTSLMAAALTSLGSTVDITGPDWSVTPGTATGPQVVDCGLAGTVMRFVPAIAGFSRGTITFDGDAHMRTRPIGPMLTALTQLGVAITSVPVPDAHQPPNRGAGRWADPSRDQQANPAPPQYLPFEVRGTGQVPGGPVRIDASTSSQFISALLLAGPRFESGVDVHHQGPPVPSLPHIEMTVAMLRGRGVHVDNSHRDRWTIEPGPIKAIDEVIEPDLSNAAPFVALALVSGGQVLVRDWPGATTQPGDALRGILSQMGAEVERVEAGVLVRGTGVIHGVDLDLHELGELTPAIAALCALADSPSTLRGVAHIRGHETDRITALATELTGLGARVTERADGLAFTPSTLHGGRWRTYADHRMAHAGVILGAAVDGVVIENIATTGKTFPDFANTWAGLW
ncbi:MAG: 3-phosphoshikimate 1-carboxyvinyltransferase [Nocardioides sp.]